MPVLFKNRMATPDGGKYFFVHEGESIRETPNLDVALYEVRALLRKHGSDEDPYLALAAYMCPRLPSGFCTSPSTVDVVRLPEAKKNTMALFRRDVVTFDRIEDRLRVCQGCPMNDRNACLTCTGLLDWIVASFGGRRPALRADKVTGICKCARAFTAAVASVDYGADPVPENAPEGCWRRAEKGREKDVGRTEND